MAALVFTNAEAGSGRIQLHPGINTLGRAEGNHHVVAQPSISSRHCEIILDAGIISVRDLGSTNGSFIDGHSITQAHLAHGQRLRLGDVEFLVEAPEAPPDPAGAPLRVHFAPTPVAARPSAPSLEPPRVSVPLMRTPARPQQGFYQSLPGALGYPFRKNGFLLLIMGTVLFLVLDLFTGFRGFGLRGSRFSILITVFSMGYLFAYMQKIIAHSAQGEDELPGFPDITQWWSDVLQPFLFFAGTGLISFLPALVVGLLASQHEWLGLALLPAIGFGFIYLPMALLAVAVSDNFLALSPHIVVPSIFRVFVPYLVTFLMFTTLVALRFAGGFAASQIPLDQIPLRIAATVVMGFVSLYLLTVEMRVLGTLFRCYRERLGWLG